MKLKMMIGIEVLIKGEKMNKKNKIYWVNIETKKGQFKPVRRKVIVLNKKEGKLLDRRKVLIQKDDEGIVFYFVLLETNTKGGKK